MPSPSAAAISAPSASPVIMVPVGLAGLANRSPASGFARWAAISACGVSAQRFCGRDLDRHRLAAERREDVAVGRIAGTGDGDPVARLEHGEEGEQEARRGAGRHHDAAGIDVDAVALAVVRGDAPAQRRDAQRFGIADPRGSQGRMGRGPRGRRRGRRRLADLHMDDSPARCFEPRRRRHHVHHHEWLHVAAQRRRHQPFGQIEHCLPALAQPAPLPPHLPH